MTTDAHKPMPQPTPLICGEACGADSLRLAGRVLSGAVSDRAEDQPVADRNRAAALCAGLRPCRRLARYRELFAGLSLDNYAFLGSDPLYFLSYLKSLEIAALSTIMLLAIGYPIAYAMTRAPRQMQPVLVLLIILPFWTSFLIRIYAWMNILQHDGPLNRLLLALDLVREPPVWLSTNTAVYIGIVYSYLPFMVLPLYATLEKLDESLLEAAADLGCPRWKAFWLVTVPLSAPGVIAGALLCFIPAVGEFVIPDLLGGSRTAMIGQTIWTEFFANKDWPTASAVAVVLVSLLVTPIVIFQYQTMRGVERD